MRKSAGFTLIELMVVVVIAAILAAIALPSYQQYIMRGKITEATSNLSSMRLKLEKYYADNRNYGNGACGVAVPTGADARYFTISCTGTSPDGAGNYQGFTVKAVGLGGMSNFQYQVDESNTRQSTITEPGWNSSTTCWITKKGESC